MRVEKLRSGGRQGGRRRSAVIRFGWVGLAAVLLAGCTTAYIAVGAGVLGIGAAAIAFECDEPVSVSVWAPMSAYPICDAEVVATKESARVVFSPCYATTLADGTWTVTATKPGFSPAVGTVTVERGHRCAEPTRHSLELTLGGPPQFAEPPARPMPPNVSAPATPPSPNAVPLAPEGAPNAPAPGAPPEGQAAPAGTSTAPKATFPSAPAPPR